ncbi:MAG: TIGR02186 family protein [Gemmatimonadota bacterium]|jgi:uncharacterized protein (TIGR02186 family)
MRHAAFRFATLLLSAAAGAGAQEGARPGETVSIEPAVVVAGMFYDGAVLHVRADLPATAHVVVLGRSGDAPLSLRRKGKALGILWMNVGDVGWDSVPGLYLLQSSVPLDSLGPVWELERLGIGLASLRARSRPEPGADSLFEELVRLKRKDGLWAVSVGLVSLETASTGAVAVADLPVPVKAPPGVYEVLVYAFEEGGGRLVGRGTFEVVQGGVPAFIASLAAERGLLYGVLAVVVAVVMGLVTGVVFGLGSKKGH